MNENQQIIYMQARIVRLASEEWNMSIKKVISIFTEFKVLSFIRECFGVFHVEGDYAVLEDVGSYLKNQGVDIHAEVG